MYLILVFDEEVADVCLVLMNTWYRRLPNRNLSRLLDGILASFKCANISYHFERWNEIWINKMYFLNNLITYKYRSVFVDRVKCLIQFIRKSVRYVYTSVTDIYLCNTRQQLMKQLLINFLFKRSQLDAYYFVNYSTQNG